MIFIRAENHKHDTLAISGVDPLFESEQVVEAEGKFCSGMIRTEMKATLTCGLNMDIVRMVGPAF